MDSNHCENTHPGIISNEKDLLETDEKFFKGTGKSKDFESAVMDTYLKRNVRENYDYEIYN